MASRRPKQPSQRYPISTTVGDVEVHGEYVIDGEFVTVYAANGKTHGTQIGRSSAAAVASGILYQLNSDFRRPGSSSEDAC